MNANENAVHDGACGVLHCDEPEQERSAGVRVAPREFEALLQRAMEILKLRARTATPSGS